jgi:excisionase family DNA binding protein
MEHKLMTTSQAADYMELKPSTLEVWRVYGKGPRFMKLGKAVRYRMEDLNAFLEESVKSSTSEYVS